MAISTRKVGGGGTVGFGGVSSGGNININIISNALDLNNLPEDFTRECKQPSDDPSTSERGQRRKKSEDDKVYECRFCSLKFCKSQALGGHMNRHRQERETESLNKARQLVFGTDNLISPYGPLPPPPPLLPHHHLGTSSYHHQPPPSIYPSNPRMYSPVGSPVRLPNNNNTTTTTTAHLFNQQQPFHVYTPPPPPVPLHPHQHYPTPPPHDYFLGHPNYYNYMSSTHDHTGSSTNYTCVGAPVVNPDDGFIIRENGQVLTGTPGEENGSLMSWELIDNSNPAAGPGRRYRDHHHQRTRMDHTAAAAGTGPINHFKDGF